MLDIENILMNDIGPSSPEYENNIRTKLKGYNLIITFPTCPVPSEKVLAFPAYVKKVTDTFTPTYEKKTNVYGRMDAIPVYQRTTRQIGFDLTLPSYGLQHSFMISRKLDILVKNLYPSYQPNGNVNVIASPPLASVFFSNLIYDAKTDSPLLGFFDGAVKIEHDLEKGVFSRGEGFETYPRAYTLAFVFNVLHQYTPGYVNTSGFVSNPVNILQSIIR